MAETKENDVQVQEALRVSQLDASELDSELFELLRGRLESAFKYFKPGLLAKYGPELNAALRFVLWKYTVHSWEATVGQKLLELRYHDEKHSPGGSTIWMSGAQKWLYAILTIGGPWLQERRDDLFMYTEEYRHGKKLWRVIDWLINGWKVAALMNFLVFLMRGRQQYLIERLLGIRAMFPRPQGIRQIGFEYMDRELLWHGFAEFLFFILPLINFSKVKNFLVRQFLPSSREKSSEMRSESDYHECAVCGLWPYNPREIGCRHVFCYYCVKSNFAADPAFTCPHCNQAIGSADDIQPVRVTTQPIAS